MPAKEKPRSAWQGENGANPNHSIEAAWQKLEGKGSPISPCLLCDFPSQKEELPDA
jgi:hypothetical protein